jgi:hypothetical protein
MMEIPSMAKMPERRIIAIWEQKAEISVLDRGVTVFCAI